MGLLFHVPSGDLPGSLSTGKLSREGPRPHPQTVEWRVILWWMGEMQVRLTDKGRERGSPRPNHRQNRRGRGGSTVRCAHRSVTCHSPTLKRCFSALGKERRWQHSTDSQKIPLVEKRSRNKHGGETKRMTLAEGLYLKALITNCCVLVLLLKSPGGEA